MTFLRLGQRDRARALFAQVEALADDRDPREAQLAYAHRQVVLGYQRLGERRGDPSTSRLGRMGRRAPNARLTPAS